MKISGTVAKMESAEKDDAENIDFNEDKEKDEEQNEVEDIKQVEMLDVSADELSVHPAFQCYSAMPDILASFRRTLAPRQTS